MVWQFKLILSPTQFSRIHSRSSSRNQMNLDFLEYHQALHLRYGATPRSNLYLEAIENIGDDIMCYLQVIPSRNVKVAGLFGPAARLERKTAHASENEMGLGNTSIWRLTGLDTRSTVCVLFDVTAATSKYGNIPHLHFRF